MYCICRFKYWHVVGDGASICNSENRNNFAWVQKPWLRQTIASQNDIGRMRIELKENFNFEFLAFLPGAFGLEPQSLEFSVFPIQKNGKIKMCEGKGNFTLKHNVRLNIEIGCHHTHNAQRKTHRLQIAINLFFERFSYFLCEHFPILISYFLYSFAFGPLLLLFHRLPCEPMTNKSGRKKKINDSNI